MLDLPAAFASPLTLDAAAWVQLLHWALTTDTEREAVVRILSCCCFLRSARHCADVQERTNEEVSNHAGDGFSWLLLADYIALAGNDDILDLCPWHAGSLGCLMSWERNLLTKSCQSVHVDEIKEHKCFARCCRH